VVVILFYKTPRVTFLLQFYTVTDTTLVNRKSPSKFEAISKFQNLYVCIRTKYSAPASRYTFFNGKCYYDVRAHISIVQTARMKDNDQYIIINE
jgi:hypothetical protein